MSHTIRQLEERHVSVEIKLLQWNDRMDLLALANAKGEVLLHRLSWQRVWCLRPEHESISVMALRWRPDGKLLAVAYSTGDIQLLEVENKNIVYTMKVGSKVSSVDWLQDKNKFIIPSDKVDKDLKEGQNDMSDSNTYLMDVKPLSNEYSTGTNTSSDNCNGLNFVKKQNELNILLVGTEDGNLHVSIFGLFTCAVINISSHLQKECKILKSQMSNDMSTIYVTVIDEDNIMTIVTIDSSIICSHSKEIFSMAMKYVHLTSLLSHLDQTMSFIREAWESILLEMDSKLSKYAANVPEGTVCADFLDLLMFGSPSDEMEEFLMQDLTDKGLKKLGHSIELSYSNIQKLLLTHMNTVGQNITYILSELRGMARLTHRYKILGLKESSVTSAITANGAFLVKGVEVQQVINNSMANYKAFFRWLYVVILRLMDEQIPPEIPKMTQQDLLYITEFLQNFDSIPGKLDQSPTRSGTQKNKFNLERLGQYLLDSEITILPNMESNVWYSFMLENECCLDHSLIKHYEKMSLIQQQKMLDKSIHKIFEDPKILISNNFVFKTSLNCMNVNLDDLQYPGVRTSQINFSDVSTLMAFTDGNLPSHGIHFVELSKTPELSLKHVFLYVKNFREFVNTNNCKVLDIQFYNTSYLSVLLTEHTDPNRAFMCQISISNIRDNLSQLTTSENLLFSDYDEADLFMFFTGTIKTIESMSAHCFSVSGSRHVSVVLSDNRHKVLLFEMEADEDEEEEDTDMTVNNTQDTEAMVEESMVAE